MPEIAKAEILLGLLFAGCLSAEAAEVKPRPALVRARLWAAFYGKEISHEAWESLDLIVSDPDAFERPSSPTVGSPLQLAYLSLGEANESRWWWTAAKDKTFAVEPNPEWPGAIRIDPRAKAWSDLVVKTVVPHALKRGYDGFMLDTVDVAEYLESSAPVRFAGSVDGMAALVGRLRQERPNTLILMNGGFSLLERLGPVIDGVMAEDLYTRCLPGSERCVSVPESDWGPKLKALKAFRERTGKPVFAFIYAHPSERGQRRIRSAVRRARADGFLPYVASPSLLRLGTPGGGP